MVLRRTSKTAKVDKLLELLDNKADLHGVEDIKYIALDLMADQVIHIFGGMTLYTKNPKEHIYYIVVAALKSFDKNENTYVVYLYDGANNGNKKRKKIVKSGMRENEAHELGNTTMCNIMYERKGGCVEKISGLYKVLEYLVLDVKHDNPTKMIEEIRKTRSK